MNRTLRERLLATAGALDSQIGCGDGLAYADRGVTALMREAAAALGEQEPDGWQPIETAPRDGRWLLGYWGDNRVESMRWGGECWVHYDGDSTFTKPTHWRRYTDSDVEATHE